MSTIREIAEKANVSVATVSRVLNGKSGASEKKAQEIMEIAKAMNYTPNMLAKGLKNRQTRTIGIITEDITVFNTPEIVDGIDDYCEKHGYHYILGNLRLNKRFGHNFFETDMHHQIVESTIGTMLSKMVEGIIFIGCHNHEINYFPTDLSVPLVCAYCFSNNPEIHSIIFNEKKAAYDATCVLIAHGHRKVGIICGIADGTPSQNRLLGFQEALYDHGILFNPNDVAYGDWERESGYQNSKYLIDNGVTAIFAQNDVMACGVMDYCSEVGISVGTELSIIGFDNKEISTACRPRLSTVSLPLFQIGQTATETIIAMIEESNDQIPHQIILPCDIVERESVATIKASQKKSGK